MKKEEIFNILYGKEKWDVWEEFQKTEKSIEDSKEIYDYYDEIKNMLLNQTSHVRLRSFRIICKLAKWDKQNKIDEDINLILSILDDDKPTIVRQCLSALPSLLDNKKEISNVVKNKLRNLNLEKYKDSMRPLIQKDIESLINKQ